MISYLVVIEILEIYTVKHNQIYAFYTVLYLNSSASVKDTLYLVRGGI